MHSLLLNVHTLLADSDSSRCVVYRNINPSFCVHDVYKTKHAINEFHRISFTKFRVSGHSLAVETGRWNKRGRGRLPLEERLCVCGDIQTERHVVEVCTLSENIRQVYRITTLEDLFSDDIPHSTTCKIIHEILELYK